MDTRRLIVSVVVVVGIVGGCVTAVPPVVTEQPAPTVPSVSPQPTPMLDWSSLPLDAASRRLLAVLEPGELVRVDVDTPDADRLIAAAVVPGVTAEGSGRNDAATIRGDPNVIRAMLEGLTIRSVSLAEDDAALRFIPDAAPTVQIGVPGRPYLAFGLPQDILAVPLPPEAREALTHGLAMTATSIDGRPYEIVEVTGGCEGDRGTRTCHATLVGLPAGALREGDWWSVTAEEQTRWLTRAEPVTTPTGVPRPVLRAAEWVARHDPDALRLIRRYSTCCDAWWDPTSRGRITVFYTRDCTMSLEPPAARVADTGECVDGLEIVVDLRTASVVRVTEHAGP